MFPLFSHWHEIYHIFILSILTLSFSSIWRAPCEFTKSRCLLTLKTVPSQEVTQTMDSSKGYLAMNLSRFSSESMSSRLVWPLESGSKRKYPNLYLKCIVLFLRYFVFVLFYLFIYLFIYCFFYLGQWPSPCWHQRKSWPLPGHPFRVKGCERQRELHLKAVESRLWKVSFAFFYFLFFAHFQPNVHKVCSRLRWYRS
jgi:hypothetical protein